jgi:hypothetical protein
VAEDVPLPRPRPAAPPAWTEPHSFREAAGADFNTAEVTAKLSDCDERIAKIAAVEAMPRLIGPGACGGADLIRVDAVLLPDQKRIEIKPAPYLRCLMAEQLAAWVREEAAPKVGAVGPALRSVETYDDFECRGRNRQVGGKISEHGKANAIDVRGFTLVDGQFIGLTDIAASKDLRDDLRKTACARFSTVLGPGSDGYHEAHIHLDFIQRRSGYRMCQWDVREPPKPPAKPAAPAADVAAGEPAHGPTDEGADAPAAPAPIAEAFVPLPMPRPARADRIRNRHRKLGVSVHLPFILWR